jgi:hypothetical protein
VGNFQGTYVHPGNSWDLWACTQKPDESLRDFIRCLSKRCTKLPSVVQSVIVHAFLEGTTYRDLVRELGRSPPVDSHELFDIATSFSFGDEAVGAIFDGKNGKRMDDVPMEGSKSKERQKKQKWGKRAKSPTATHTRRDATRTTMRPSQSTLPTRALEGPLEALACLTTDMLKNTVCPLQ